MSLRFALAVPLLAAASAFAGGCQSHRIARMETYTENSPYAVLDTPALRQLKAEYPPPPAEDAWWTTRNETLPSVEHGYQTVQVVDYTIYSEDRQQTYSGRNNDTVRQTTRSARYGRWVR